MATVGVRTFEQYKASEKEWGDIFEYGEAASQSFKKGDPVVLDTSGQVKLAVDTGNVYGLAWEDATGTTGNVVKVLKLEAGMEFSVSQSNAGAAQVSAQSQVGLQCSFIKSSVTGSTDKTVIDTADTTNKVFEIIDLDERDAVGDSNGRVVVRPVPAKLVAR